MKYLAAANVIISVAVAVYAAGIVNYGSVEFDLLKRIAVSGWMFSGLSSLNALLSAAAKKKEAGE